MHSSKNIYKMARKCEQSLARQERKKRENICRIIAVTRGGLIKEGCVFI